jgi:hypothetical protein
MSSLESELRDELNIVIMQLEGTTKELERLQKLARGLAQAIGFIQGGLDPHDPLIEKRVDPYLEYTDEIERLQKELEIYKDLYAAEAVKNV